MRLVQSIQVNDVELAHALSGNVDGKKIVLVHGLFLNSDSWKDQLSTLEQKFHVLRYDLRGHGRSSKPTGQFTIRDHVNDLRGLLDAIGWKDEVCIVGHSLGGMIGLAFALQHAERVDKLVLASTFCHITDEAMTDVMGRLIHSSLDKFARGIAVRGLSPFNEETASFIEEMVTDHLTKEQCLIACSASAGFSICQDISKIKHPSLVIVGREDITTPPWASEMLHQWLPNSELVIIPQAGHLLMLDHPSEFNEHVTKFLEK